MNAGAYFEIATGGSAISKLFNNPLIHDIEGVVIIVDVTPGFKTQDLVILSTK